MAVAGNHNMIKHILRAYQLQEADIRHNFGMLFFRNDRSCTTNFVHVPTYNKGRMG
jgi:hypothetical protein